MPGLYKNKRKRPTINSSYLHDNSVWHSTPVDSEVPETSNQSEEEEEDESMVSPVKRPTLGGGVRAPVLTTPIGIRIDTGGGNSIVNMTSQQSLADGRNDDTPGPSSHSMIQTPAVVANIVLDSVDGNEAEADLFQDMEEMEAEEVDKSPPNKRPPQSASFMDERNIHRSQRFGPVVIHPPSGHPYFCTVLQQHGFLLTLPKNHLCHDISKFRTQLNKWIQESTNEYSRIEDNATKFIKAMKKYFSTKENLGHACTTTLNDGECIQPSLLACMLGVPLAQKALLEVVLPALSEVAFSNAQEDVDFVNTLVNQMKWLPAMVDGNKFADDLLNILDAAVIPAKKHIIRLLPEIFLPEYHPHLVPKLMEIFDIGTQISVSMLDCLSSLVVPDEDCLRIRRSAVDKMSSAPLEDLPAYLSFLFRVGSPLSQLEEGIREMREKLEIKPEYRIPKEDALQAEILERIRFFVSVNSAIVKIWIAQMKLDISIEIALPTLDLLMLFVFHEAGSKPALSTLMVLFSRPDVVNELFDKMMKNNNQMLHDLFPTIARFLDSVLRLKNSKCHEAAADITKKLFVGLGPVLSQHLTSNLIGVLINGHPSCRDVVLKIFTSIAETDAPKLLYFHSYLMGALVYVLKYPPRQMEALMNILAILAYMPENIQGEENAFTAEFMILLRKQITHINGSTRCFGVLGTIAAVRQLATHPTQDNESKIDGLLALAWSSIENDEEACSIFFDEMISCIKVLPKTICIEFREILKMQFERLFTVDQDSETFLQYRGIGQAGLELAPTFDANKEMEHDKLIIVLEPQTLQMSPLVVPSLFRVMAELEKVSENGELENIDAVLGCPVFFPKFSTYYDRSALSTLSFSQRCHLGQYLVICLNYFRECVSAFVESDNAELRVKVWMRLSNIITLQRILVKHYQSFPCLPTAYETEKHKDKTDSSGAGFSGTLLPGRKPGTSAKKPKKPKVNKKKGKKTKKKRSTDDDEDESEVNLESDDEEPQAEKKLTLDLDLEEQIQPKFVGSYIRRLDVQVFQLLKFPFKPVGEPVNYTQILLNLSSATQSAETMRQIQQLNPDTLVLLLSELKKQTTDNKHNLKILEVQDLLSSLCTHIDAIPDLYAHQSAPLHDYKVDSCLKLLINVMDLYFETVSKQEKVKKAELIEHIVLSMSSRNRLQGDVDENASQIELVSNVAEYLSNFVGFVGYDNPHIAQDHVKLMKTLHDLLPHPDPMKRAIETTIKHYLQREWKLPSSTITYFFKIWFAVTLTPMEVVRHFVDHLLAAAEEENDHDDSASVEIPNTTVYKSCNKSNFHTWYTAILSGLVNHVVKMGRRRGDFADSIQLWFEGNELLKSLVNVSIQIKKSAILTPLIRSSRLYLEAFISGGVCLMPELWKQDFEKGQEFSKTLQVSTRRLQNICEFSKLMKDNLLLRHVPPMKKALEAFLFKVRESITNKGIYDGIWVGELKHRNLDGKVISSQAFQPESDSESEEEDQTEESEMLVEEVEDDEESLMDVGNEESD